MSRFAVLDTLPRNQRTQMGLTDLQVQRQTPTWSQLRRRHHRTLDRIWKAELAREASMSPVDPTEDDWAERMFWGEFAME